MSGSSDQVATDQCSLQDGLHSQARQEALLPHLGHAGTRPRPALAAPAGPAQGRPRPRPRVPADLAAGPVPAGARAAAAGPRPPPELAAPPPAGPPLLPPGWGPAPLAVRPQAVPALPPHLRTPPRPGPAVPALQEVSVQVLWQNIPQVCQLDATHPDTHGGAAVLLQVLSKILLDIIKLAKTSEKYSQQGEKLSGIFLNTNIEYLTNIYKFHAQNRLKETIYFNLKY